MGALSKQPVAQVRPQLPEDLRQDLRQDQRVSMMLRMAKLVTDCGEYVCVIRDVSATGLRLQLFHDLPGHSPLWLELSNGERHGLETVWQSEAQAGFRFLAQVDLNCFIEEPAPWPRRPLRLKLRRPALVMANGLQSPATVLDLSQNGARIETLGYFTRSQWLQIEIEGLSRRHASVRWHRGSAHGLMFEQALRLDELAHFAVMAQPLPAISPQAVHSDPSKGLFARLGQRIMGFSLSR